MQKIFSFFNIRLQKHQPMIALSCFLSLLLNSYYSPMLCKTAISAVPAQWLSFETIWCCGASLIVGMMWKGSFRKNAIKWFMYGAIAESVCGFCLGMYLAFVQWNVWVYAIFSLFYVSVVSLTIGRCVMAFKAKLWTEKSRETFDNTDSVIRNIALLTGSLLAIVACPSLKLALVLFGVCCVIDDIGWIYVYLKCKDELKEI